MADETKPAAGVLDAGEATSEGRITIATVAVALLIALLGAIKQLLDGYHQQHPENAWVGLILPAVAVLSAGLASFGFSKARTAFKSEALVAALQQEVPGAIAAVGALFSKGPPPPSVGTQAPAAPLPVFPHVFTDPKTQAITPVETPKVTP